MISLSFFVVTGAFATPLKLNDTNFATQAAGKLVIVDFYADWCGPCVRFSPTFEAVSKANSSIVFAKVDVDASPNLSSQFNIRAIPYIAAIHDGKVVAEFRGSRTEASFQTWSREQNSKYSSLVSTPPAPPSPPALSDSRTGSASAPWQGLWNTKWGVSSDINLDLKQVGSKVTGSYSWKNGTIEGAVTGSVVKGTWTQSDGKGWFTLTLTPKGNRFTGEWGYATGRVEGYWNGTKPGPGSKSLPQAQFVRDSLPADAEPLLRDELRIWTNDSETDPIVINQSFPGLKAKMLPIKNHYKGLGEVFVAVYTNSKDGGVYPVGNGLYVAGLIRLKGTWRGSLAQPEGWEGRDISGSAEFKKMADGYFPAIRGKAWVGGETGGFFGY